MNVLRLLTPGVAALLLLYATGATAVGFPMPSAGNDLIGEMQLARASQDETLLDVARMHDIGQEEIRLANPGIDRWLPQDGEPLVIPSHYVLPDAPRKGLVLNLPEMRVYHFRPGKGDKGGTVDTYPASIGRMDWKTPLGGARIVRKQRDPSWRPPASVRQEAAAEGESLPELIPAGPENPLGTHALRLNLPGYLIHGTNKPYGVGMRVTHGCVRLLPEDISELFERVRVGTAVQIVNQPVKTGWQDGVLFVEVHPPLDEDERTREDLLRFTLERVYEALEERPAALDGRALRRAVADMHGMPVAISRPGVPGRKIDNPLFR